MNGAKIILSDIKEEQRNVALSHLVSTTPTVTNWQPRVININQLPLNGLESGVMGLKDETVAEPTPTTKDVWFPIEITTGGASNTNTQQNLEDEKRRRMLWIAGGVLAALILLTVVLTMKKS